jgi:hypothetical protein
MTQTFTAGDVQVLRAPHVGIAHFLRIDWPSGVKRYHDGAGRAFIGGFEWEGVSDPFGNRLAFMQQADFPQLGTAPAYQVVIIGADVAFMKYVHNNARVIEGTTCQLYMAAIDGETGEEGLPLRSLIKGKLTAARNFWSGIGERAVTITIEGPNQAKNFSYDGKWTSAGQRRRYPGDAGGDFIGQNVSEMWK